MGSDSTLPPQVQEGRACPSVLELPTVLLQMERSRRAQEQVGSAGQGVRQRAGRVPPHVHLGGLGALYEDSDVETYLQHGPSHQVWSWIDQHKAW